jgi:O-antigen ligase
VVERGDPSARALELAKDYPVFGAGGGTFYTAFPRYRGPELKAYFDFAHNDYIQFLAETGVVGLALAGSLPLFALVLAVLALARRRDPLARGFAFAVLMGVVSLGIHSTVDFNLQIPANALAFLVLIAYGWVAMYLERKD